MSRSSWLMPVAFVVMTLPGAAVDASCQLEGPYEVVQCGQSAWFAPPPFGAGAVTPVWWQVGMGNATLRAPGTNSASDGSGFLLTPLPGLFIGNDSGLLGAPDLDLVDASTFPGLGAPAGALCFSSRAAWDIPGLDGCPDMNRSYRFALAGSWSDNYLNIYWSTYFGPGYLYYSNMLDAPMGVLLTESNHLFFALAFFASESRQHDVFDITAGRFDLSAIGNGQPGPTGDNLVPWQPIPQPYVTLACEPPSCATQSIFFGWNPVAIHSDQSSRPCLLLNEPAPCTTFAPGVVGVGVLDQGPLARYQAERATLGGLGCLSDWAPIPGGLVEHPASSMTISGLVTPFCVRLTTLFGRKPATTPCTAATTACRDANRAAAQTGRLGDIGYQVSSLPTIIGWPLAAESVTLTSATRGRGGVTVDWTASSELSVTGYDIVALKARGKREVLAASVACRECTTGAAASYSVQVPPWKLRGARSVRVVVRPSGIESEARAIQ